MRGGIRRRDIMGFEGVERRKRSPEAWERETLLGRNVRDKAEISGHDSGIRRRSERQGDSGEIAEPIKSLFGPCSEGQPGKGASKKINTGLSGLNVSCTQWPF
jgi:hypothetical protein